MTLSLPIEGAGTVPLILYAGVFTTQILRTALTGVGAAEREGSYPDDVPSPSNSDDGRQKTEKKM